MVHALRCLRDYGMGLANVLAVLGRSAINRPEHSTCRDLFVQLFIFIRSVAANLCLPRMAFVDRGGRASDSGQ